MCICSARRSLTALPKRPSPIASYLDENMRPVWRKSEAYVHITLDDDGECVGKGKNTHTHNSRGAHAHTHTHAFLTARSMAAPLVLHLAAYCPPAPRCFAEGHRAPASHGTLPPPLVRLGVRCSDDAKRRVVPRVTLSLTCTAGRVSCVWLRCPTTSRRSAVPDYGKVRGANTLSHTCMHTHSHLPPRCSWHRWQRQR